MIIFSNFIYFLNIIVSFNFIQKATLKIICNSICILILDLKPEGFIINDINLVLIDFLISER